jgi:mannose-1-phosphate guanylyltransferase/mannose-1-phosphate guanylyltransferase/mannose-6-phosphate isomerase
MITPVILSGGSGTRLWPLSRRSYPKQFSALLGDDTLFQRSIKRLTGPGFAPPVILTNSEFRFIVGQQLSDIGVDPGAILIEPESRNTGPAILAASLHALSADPKAVLLVVPSDHEIPDAQAFADAVSRGRAALEAGNMVLFGIAPTRPDTGYGYLELAHLPEKGITAIPLRRFVEKPVKERAQAMLDAGNFLWNAGIFLFRAADMVAAFEQHMPEMMAPVRASLANARADLGFLRLAADGWSQAPSISVDYAVMERATKLAVIPYDGKWLDLGGWDGVWAGSTPDTDTGGTVTNGAAHAIDCKNSLLRSESEGVELVGIGLQNIIAVAMSDAVLVADMSCAQRVREAVELLKKKSVSQAERFLRDYRPWGWFETLALGPRFQVKRIVVHPGASLSLQRHFHRSEHWIVVQGTAKVTVDDTVQTVSENQSVYVPLGAAHRMENPGKLPMILIEVQTGSYLGEDDIVRLEDAYARV